MEGIQIRAVTGGAAPFLSAFDCGSFAPLIEGGDQLKVRARGDHVPDVLFPIRRTPQQAHVLADLPEAGRDGKRIGRLIGDLHGRRILVPIIRLVGAGFVTDEDFQNYIGAHGVRLLPAIGHTASVTPLRIDEDHKAPANAEVAGVTAVVIPDIR